MASILNVDQINNAAGTSALTIDSSGNVNIPGHVVQVVYEIYNGSAGTTSSSYTAFGRSISITPKFANSIIIVSWSATAYRQGVAYLTVFRTLSGGSATNMYNNGNYNTNSSTESLRQLGSTSGAEYFPGHMSFIDTTHNSTSSITYDVYGKTGGGTSVYFPPGSSDAADVVAMEIAQ